MTSQPPATTTAAPASPPGSGLGFMTALRFLLDQPNALNNLLLAVVMNIIPIVGPIVLMGWQCEIIQRLVKRHPNPIPKLDFNDFVYFLGRGVSPFVVMLILTLPLTLLVMILMFVGMFGLAFATAGSAQHGGEPSPVLIVAGVGVMLLLFLAIILPFNIFMMSALLRAELTEDIGKSLSFGALMAFVRRTWKDFLAVYLVMLPVTLLGFVFGAAFCFIGIYPVLVIANMAYLHLRWQIYEKYLREGGEAIPMQTKSGPLPSETPRTAAPPPAPPAPRPAT